MPLPEPQDNQDKEEFMEMCMSDSIMEEEFPDNDRRYAVCEAQWENSSKGGDNVEYKDKPFSETKDFTFEIKELNEEKRIFEGYASVFGNVDAYGDIVQKGAFKKTINERKDKIKILWQHNPTQPIGKLSEAKEDNIGLKIKGKISKTEKGDEVLQLMKDGVIDELSIGYNTIKKDYDDDGNRLLKEIKLFEVSPVTFAANPLAGVTSVKSLEDKINQKDLMSEMEAEELQEERWRIQSAFNETIRDILTSEDLATDEKKTAFNESLNQYTNLMTEWFNAMLNIEDKDFDDLESKEGRVLSSTNYQRVMDALALLEEVLSDAEPAKSTQIDDNDDLEANEGDNEPGNHSDNNEELDKKLDELLDMTKEFTQNKESD